MKNMKEMKPAKKMPVKKTVTKKTKKVVKY